MKHLTFLDYTRLEVTGKNVEARVAEKEKVTYLRQREVNNSDEIALMKLNHEKEIKQMGEEMNRHYSQIMLMMQENPRLTQIKPQALSQKQLLK